MAKLTQDGPKNTKWKKTCQQGSLFLTLFPHKIVFKCHFLTHFRVTFWIKKSPEEKALDYTGFLYRFLIKNKPVFWGQNRGQKKWSKNTPCFLPENVHFSCTQKIPIFFVYDEFLQKNALHLIPQIPVL